MKSFSRWVVKYPWAIVIICALLLLPGLYGMVHTRINYDLLTYLPHNLNSVKGQEILEKDFRVAGNAFLMVNDTSDWQVKSLKQRLEKVDGVEKVTWIDNWTDITVPSQFIPEKVRNQFYHDNSTLLQIQFKEGSGSGKTQAAIGNIKEVLNENMYLGGTSAVLSDLRVLIDHERLIYLLAAIALIFLILALTLSSTIIPVLFLISIGAAIIYNMGTNLVFGSTSYVTSAIAAVLQLGVTMDFSIFLVHRYLEEKAKQESREEAMAQAIEKTFVAIGASSLTAIAGFLSLSVMQIGIGKDMGIVMAKGVALGVVVSLTLLPALIVLCDKIITRYQHRVFMPRFEWTARTVSKRYWVLAVLFVLLLVPAYYGKENVKLLYNVADALPHDMQSVKSTDHIKQSFGSADTLYLVTPADQNWKLKKINAYIKKMPGVVSVTGLTDLADVAIPEKYVPKKVLDSFSNGQYEYTVIQSKYQPADPQSTVLIKNIRSLSGKFYKTSYLSGESVLTDDMIKLVGTDQKAVDMWSIGAILAILLVTFGSVSLPIILVLVIELAIFINLAIPYYMGTTIPFIAVMTIGAIQLGSCVNYAILMVSRFKEELASHDKFTAAHNAVMGTAPSIVTSALALFSATIGVGFISKIDMIGSLSMMIARGALISMLAILFFLPAILIVCQGIITRTTLHWNRGVKVEGGTESE